MDTTAPTTPGTLSSPSKTTTTIALSWGASTDTGGSGLAGYNVYRNGSATPTAQTTGTTYTDTGLTANTTYTYTVKARDGAGNLSAEQQPDLGHHEHGRQHGHDAADHPRNAVEPQQDHHPASRWAGARRPTPAAAGWPATTCTATARPPRPRRPPRTSFTDTGLSGEHRLHVHGQGP